MMQKLSAIPLSRSLIGYAAAIFIAAVSFVVFAGEDKSEKTAKSPGIIFTTPLPDVPGKRLVVGILKLGKTEGRAHRHPGSVYGYVIEGTALFGIAGQPVQTVRAGESFFEPANAVHTVLQSASATEPVTVIAMQIAPVEGPLIKMEEEK